MSEVDNTNATIDESQNESSVAPQKAATKKREHPDADQVSASGDVVKRKKSKAKKKRAASVPRGEFSTHIVSLLYTCLFSSFQYKVLKQVNPEVRIGEKSMAIMDSFVADMFNRICTESSRLTQYTKRNIISANDVQAAVRLSMPGELAKHAVSEGNDLLLCWVIVCV